MKTTSQVAALRQSRISGWLRQTLDIEAERLRVDVSHNGRSAAVFEDGVLGTGAPKVRYALFRDLTDESPQDFAGVYGMGIPRKVLGFVLCNPSTAGAYRDDRTVTLCSSIARRWGFPQLVIVNTTPMVSTDPSATPKGLPHHGVVNDALVTEVARNADMVVCGWGTVASRTEAAHALSVIRRATPRALYAVGVTVVGGVPRHPLRTVIPDEPRIYRRALTDAATGLPL